MSQPIEDQLTPDDASIIESYRLGSPLGVYRLKSGYIRLFRWAGLFLCMLCVVVLVMVVIVSLRDWHRPLGIHQEQVKGFFEFMFSSSYIFTPYIFSALLACFSALFFGGLVLSGVVPQLRREHVIVCEEGFVQVGAKIWSNRVEIVLWSDIVAVRELYFGLEYHIVRRWGEHSPSPGCIRTLMIC
ncbi:MAG: hypothetical protein J2P36_31215 [Ktedonobacteraceae bacterium]|nr:hypothetical protein [Ktedonobacteraceae bacterium]